MQEKTKTMINNTEVANRNFLLRIPCKSNLSLTVFIRMQSLSRNKKGVIYLLLIYRHVITHNN